MQADHAADSGGLGSRPPAGGAFRRRLAERYPWLVFVLPILVYSLAGALEPGAGLPEAAPPAAADEGPRSATEIGSAGGAVPAGPLGLETRHYPWIYTAKIALTCLAIYVVWPGYAPFLPLRSTPLAVLVGVLGAGLWVALASRGIERAALEAVGLDWLSQVGRRSGFDPFTQLAGNPLGTAAFLGVRFFGLVLVVPLMEEFFLRGFVMRVLVAPRWTEVPFGTWDTTAVAATTALAVLMHPPTELVAELVWFSLVTVLMLRTRVIWDCVTAHAVTNLLLGLYVLASRRWELM